MIDNCNAPRHNDVVADYETSIADEIAPANERTAPYPNFATPFLEAYVGMDYRIITDRQLVSRNAPNAPPRYHRSTAHRNCSRASATPAKSGINQAKKQTSRHNNLET
jgi:hypothetical protein